MSSAIGNLVAVAGGNTSLLRYSASAAGLTVLGWQAYQHCQKKAVSGKSWQDYAREKKRNAAANFCSYVNSFYYSLRLARDHLHTGHVEEAMAVLVQLLETWQFQKQTLKALKKYLHPEFFARLINILVERKMFNCGAVLSHLSSGAPSRPAHHVGLNMDMHLP